MLCSMHGSKVQFGSFRFVSFRFGGNNRNVLVSLPKETKHARKLEIPVIRIVSLCFGGNKFVSEETFNVSRETLMLN